MAMMENLAREIENAEVITVNRNGVEKKGLSIRKGNVAAVVYEEQLKNCTDTQEAIEFVNKVVEAHQADMERLSEGSMEFFTNYENIKGMLTVRLLSKNDKAEVFRKADARGFKGLKIVPYVNTPEGMVKGQIKVTKSHINLWGVSEKEVIDQALKNTSKEEKLVKSLIGFMADLTGNQEMYEEIPDGPIIVSNKGNYFGAAQILGLIPGLKKKYANGFFVIPSSVHEVLVMPKGFNGFDEDMLTDMVQDVNSSVIIPEERLADQAFVF